MNVSLNSQLGVIFKEQTSVSLPTPPKSCLASFIAMCSFCLQALIRGVTKLFCLRERVKKIDVDTPLNNKTIVVINPPALPRLSTEHLVPDPFPSRTTLPPQLSLMPNEACLSEEPATLLEVTSKAASTRGEEVTLPLSALPIVTTTEDLPLAPLAHPKHEELAANATQPFVPESSSAPTPSAIIVSVEKVFEERITPAYIDSTRDNTSETSVLLPFEIVSIADAMEVKEPTALTPGVEEVNENASSISLVPEVLQARNSNESIEGVAHESAQTLVFSPEVKIVDFNERDLEKNIPMLEVDSIISPIASDVVLEVSDVTHSTTVQASETPVKPALQAPSVESSLEQIALMSLEDRTKVSKVSVKPRRIFTKRKNDNKKMPIPPKPKKASWSVAKVIKLIFIGALGAYIGSYAENLVPKTTPPVLSDALTSEFKFATSPVNDDRAPPLKQKICVFTSYTQDNADRLLMSRTVAENQKAYAQANEYQYIVREENLAVDINPVTGMKNTYLPYWSKIVFINNILNNQDTAITEKPEWLVWMDDDVVVSNAQVRLEEVIAHYTKDANVNFFVTQDSMSHLFTFIPLNSAILFIRNNEWSKEFFSSVWKMRNINVNFQDTYGNCPNQSCLHEQQAITDLIKEKPELKRHVKIIPQRDSENNWGINTFHRWSHWDAARSMQLNYAGDLPAGKWQPGDFLGQCTGLSVEHRWTCVNHLLNNKR